MTPLPLSPTEQVGQYLRKLRFQQGWSIRQLEQFTKIGRNRLTRQENGTVMLDEAALCLVVQHLNGDIGIVMSILHPDEEVPVRESDPDAEYLYSLHLASGGMRGVRARHMEILPGGGLELSDAAGDVIIACAPGEWVNCWREDKVKHLQPLTSAPPKRDTAGDRWANGARPHAPKRTGGQR